MSDHQHQQAGRQHGADQTVEQAVTDLANRLNVSITQVSVVSTEHVTWPDGSLGDPQPGMMYPQVLVDGTRIVLESGRRRYEYYTGGQQAPFLCHNLSAR